MGEREDRCVARGQQGTLAAVRADLALITRPDVVDDAAHRHPQVRARALQPPYLAGTPFESVKALVMTKPTNLGARGCYLTHQSVQGLKHEALMMRSFRLFPR